MYAWQRLTSSGEEGRMTRLQSSRKSALLRPPGHKFLPAAPRNGYNGHVTVKNARVFVFCTGGRAPQMGRGGAHSPRTQSRSAPLMGVCWVLLCMHRECCAMEKCAANAALGSAREPDGGFDCASSVVLFRSRRVGVRAGVTDKREKVGAHF